MPEMRSGSASGRMAVFTEDGSYTSQRDHIQAEKPDPFFWREGGVYIYVCVFRIPGPVR
jgi:hypothetical protein